MIKIRVPQGKNIADLVKNHYECLKKTLLSRIDHKRKDNPDALQKQFLKDKSKGILSEFKKTTSKKINI